LGRLTAARALSVPAVRGNVPGAAELLVPRFKTVVFAFPAKTTPPVKGLILESGRPETPPWTVRELDGLRSPVAPENTVVPTPRFMMFVPEIVPCPTKVNAFAPPKVTTLLFMITGFPNVMLAAVPAMVPPLSVIAPPTNVALVTPADVDS